MYPKGPFVFLKKAPFHTGGAGTSLDPPEAKPFQFAGGEIEFRDVHFEFPGSEG